jgi:hypothetical protein
LFNKLILLKYKSKHCYSSVISTEVQFPRKHNQVLSSTKENLLDDILCLYPFLNKNKKIIKIQFNQLLISYWYVPSFFSVDNKLSAEQANKLLNYRDSLLNNIITQLEPYIVLTLEDSFSLALREILINMIKLKPIIQRRLDINEFGYPREPKFYSNMKSKIDLFVNDNNEFFLEIILRSDAAYCEQYHKQIRKSLSATREAMISAVKAQALCDLEEDSESESGRSGIGLMMSNMFMYNDYGSKIFYRYNNGYEFHFYFDRRRTII